MNNKIKSIKPFIKKENRVTKEKPQGKRVKSKHQASKKNHSHKHNLSKGEKLHLLWVETKHQ